MHSPFRANDETASYVACCFYRNQQLISALSCSLTLTSLTTVKMPPKGLRMPVNTLKGTWMRVLDTDRLRRSSQVLSVIGDRICIFGGEVQPRQPVDDKVDVLSLKPSKSTVAPSQHGPQANPIQTHQIYRPSHFLQHQVHVWEAPLPLPMAKCTSSPVVAARTWRPSKRRGLCGNLIRATRHGPV
jgi:hypothetical protein